MNKRILLVWILAMFSIVSVVVAQDDVKVYPSQYATIEAYQAATGNEITSFQGAPMLEDMDLPPVEERLPSEPVVVEPFDSIGVYGGELAGPATNPTCCGWDVLEMRLQKLVTIGPDLQTIIPNIAKDYAISDDFTTFTIYLREGHKWSDGEPFTTADFRFWFDDVLSNTDLTPSPSGPWAPNGDLANLNIIDETTLEVTFAEPNPTFIIQLGGEVNNRGYRPAHYFQQFHLDYNPDAEALAEELGFDDWIQMFNAKMTPYNNTWNLGAETDPYAPTLNTFVFVSEDTFGNKLYERNPYFFKVDTAGNQLPYIDTLRRILVEDLQVQDLRGIAGEYTHFGWGSLASFPTYRDNEEAGGYRTALIEYGRGNEFAIGFNYTIDDPVLREIYWDIRFRQAMSVAINRDEINQLIYFGLATPSQAAPVPTSAFYQDWMPEYYAQYDPELANQLLDEMGLDQRDSDGFRLRPDGETLFLNFEVAPPEEAWERIAELTSEYWNEVGVKTQLKIIESGLRNELSDSNQLMLGGHGLDIDDVGVATGLISHLRPNWIRARGVATPWQNWLESDGESGEEPPAEIIELWELSEEFLNQPFGSDSWLEVGNEFYDMTFRNLYLIGTIQRPPQPLLFKSNLMNTPPNDTTAQWSWSYRQWVMFMPEQWYFAPES